MKDVGYYKMHRGWMKNPAFRDNDERIAWLLLIERAAWDNTHTVVNGTRVDVSRGSFICSLSQIASAVGWNKQRVSRFLKRLEKADAIRTETVTGMTRVTVCNYNTYNPPADASRTLTVTKAGHKERINNKEINIEGWKEFIDAYPTGKMEDGTARRWPKSGRNSAQNVFKETVASGINAGQLTLAAENFAATKPRAVWNPKNFLKDGHYEEYIITKTKEDWWNKGMGNM